MATLQKLRDRAGLLIAIVIFVALAAFILGDLLQSGSSVFMGKQMEIAEIDGESIEYPEFQQRFDQIANIYKQNNQTNTLDENAYQQILNQTWETLVNETLMGEVYQNLGIEVTSDEMFEMVQGNKLHPIIVQVFGNQQTGEVDKAQVIQFLKYLQDNPDAPQMESWLNIEREVMKAKLNTKYTDLVGKALYANSLQAKQSLAVKEKVANLQFIQKKFNSIADSTVTFTESELKDYYNKNIDQYKQDAQKTINYIVFNIVPSEQDEKDVEKWINDIKREFENATDNVQFVNMNADNRFDDVYTKSDMLSEELSAWAFSAETGEVYGTYREGNVYKLAKLNDTMLLPDSVKASHILIRAENANEAQMAFTVADSLKNAIENKAVSFEQAAKDNSQDGSAANGGDLGWFGRGVMVAPFEKAAFRAELNEVVMVQTQFGFHLIKVTAQSKKSKHVQLAILDREIVPSTATYQKLYSDASKFAAEATNLEGFNTKADEMGLSKRAAVIKENDRQITGLGASRNLVRAAFIDSKVGDLVSGTDNSPVFEIDNKFVVAALVSSQKEGNQPFDAVKARVENEVIKDKKKAMLLADFTKAKAASIEETAQNLGLEVESANGFNFNYGSVNAIGYEPSINGAASALEVGVLSNPIAGRNGVYFIKITEINGQTEETIEQEKTALYESSSYRANFQALQAIKNNVEIVDKRSKFY
ncbi:MAG: SurA N-terminal domain-containing protein [Prolixibacteraceae bacterium]|nr:SurA N-terminal domain-containing protein [Prolixibacteraceae bacterium]